jgi:hypothetical protein
MPDLDLSSVNAKLARAEEHNRALQAQHAAMNDGSTYELVRHHNDDRTRWSWTFHVVNPPDLQRFALVFGDCIHNLRCALDHLAYAMAVHEHKGTEPLRVGYSFGFPLLHATGPTWDDTVRRKTLSTLGASVLAAMRAVQPDVRFEAETGDGKKPSKLGLLRDLDNDDKHQIILQAYGATGQGRWSPRDRLMPCRRRVTARE